MKHGVLRAKYGVREEVGLAMKVKQKSSQIWKGVLWGAELLHKGVRWTVGNGKAVVFWRDRWLGDKPLSEVTHAQIGEDELEMKVSDY